MDYVGEELPAGRRRALVRHAARLSAARDCHCRLRSVQLGAVGPTDRPPIRGA